MKQRGWIIFSGFVWFLIGIFLLCKGLFLITGAIFQPESLCCRMQGIFASAQQGATLLIGIGVLVGFFKGRFILVKTVQRVVNRIGTLPLPIRLKDAYSPSYWILIGSMVALGMVFRFLPIPVDVRGTIDVAIGSALINGAMLYFRSAVYIQKT